MITFITSNWRLVLVALALLLIAYACAMTTAWRNERAERKDAQNALNAAVEIGNKNTFYLNKKYHNDSLGWVTSTRALVVTSDQHLKALAESKDFYWINKIKGVKQDMSNVISATTFKIKYDTVFLPSKPIALTGDTTIQKSNIFHWEEKDQWNNIDVYSIGKPIFKSETEIDNVIHFGRRTKKFLFFRVGPREITSQVVPTNNRFVVTKVNTIVR